MYAVVALPVLVTLLLVVLEVAHLWQARVALQAGLDAAVLSAAKTYGETGSFAQAAADGQATAAQNTIGGQPLLLAPTDFEAGSLSIGSGTVTYSSPGNPAQAAGSVLIDATGQSTLSGGEENAWGIAFRNSPGLPSNLTITQIVITLPAGVEFDFDSGMSAVPPELSTATAGNFAVRDMSGNEQPDISGFTDPTNQITFSPTTGTSDTLTITLAADGMNDDGFEPGDRFRFGARVQNDGSNANVGGDAIGGATVTVSFSSGSPLTATLVDATFNSADCLDPAQVDGQTDTLVVHPLLIPDLPCPVPLMGGNDGQAFVQSGATSPTDHFAVRVATTQSVPSLWTNLLGAGPQNFTVRANATAFFDAHQRKPRLVRPD